MQTGSIKLHKEPVTVTYPQMNENEWDNYYSHRGAIRKLPPNFDADYEKEIARALEKKLCIGNKVTRRFQNSNFTPKGKILHFVKGVNAINIYSLRLEPIRVKWDDGSVQYEANYSVDDLQLLEEVQ